MEHHLSKVQNVVDVDDYLEEIQNIKLYLTQNIIKDHLLGTFP